MKYYQQNNCRLCAQTFCCKDCRIRHEEKIHKVNPECEICIYGRMIIKNASVTLLNHIKSAHWPLHCVFCKKIFTSLDDLIPHDKCAVKIESLKMQGTPPTPVTPVTQNNEPSPMITPFYKTLPGNTQHTTSSISMAVTSTPLVHKLESDKITPVNASDIKSIYKSSLKLTGSSNLSDSKKSDRRVTFSETPSVTESGGKTPKFLPMEQKIKEHENSDESFNSANDPCESFDEENALYKSVEEKENDDKALCSKQDLNLTMWESALTHLGMDASKKAESLSQINVSLQINVFNETIKSEDDVKTNSLENEKKQSLKTSIWSSMTNIVKSVVHNISLTAQNSFPNGGKKRLQSDTNPCDGPSYKKMKLCDIKCRRPIRNLSPLCQIRLAKSKLVDKATQTDEIWI